MVNYREILRLKDLGYNNTEIAASASSSRSTVREILKRADGLGLHWPLNDQCSNETLLGLLYPERLAKEKVYKTPDYKWIHRELAKIALIYLFQNQCW